MLTYKMYERHDWNTNVLLKMALNTIILLTLPIKCSTYWWIVLFPDSITTS